MLSVARSSVLVGGARAPSTRHVRVASVRLAPCSPRSGRMHLGTSVVVAAAEAGGGAADGEDYADVAARLNTLLEKPRMTGDDLRRCVVEKWGRSYDIILRKSGNRMYLQIMWKFLEQKSFPLTEEEYMMQLDAVAEYITDWGVVDTVKRGIAQAYKPPGMTGGRAAKCVAIPLDVDLSDQRKGEFL